ncbi:MAG: hypothetical protein LBQ56_01905 [Synergistaceae bacterium]|jgi:hypothetical protein|nr:hypothetical protein [Synergistaceae bacterium]
MTAREWEIAHAVIGGAATLIFLIQTLGTAGGDGDAGPDADFEADGGVLWVTGADS